MTPTTSFASVVCLVGLACVSGCAAGPSGSPAERYDALEVQRLQAQAEKDEARRRAFLKPRVRSPRSPAGATDGVQSSELYQVGVDGPVTTIGPEAVGRNVPQRSMTHAASGNSDTHWRVEEFHSPIDGRLLCGAVSVPRRVDNGGLPGTLHLLVTGKAFFLRADTLVDVSVLESGVSVDASIPQRFDQQHNEVTAIIDAGIEPLLDRLVAGSTVAVSFALGESTKLQRPSTIEYTLDGFPDRSRLESECRV